MPDTKNYVRQEKKGFSKAKLLKILVTLLAVVCVVQIVVYLVILPCAVPAQIQFHGLQSVSAESLLGAAGVTSGQTWITFDFVQVAKAMRGHPLIEMVEIEKKFPDQIIVTVSERKAAAVALTTIEGRTVPVQIDKNGVVFRVNEGMPAGSVPLISGLTFEQPRGGMRLHAKLRPLMARLAEIQKNTPQYFAVISEIRIVPKEYGNFDLILYPMRSHVRVLMDHTLNDEALNYMIVILDVLNTLDKSISEIDLRYGSISYKTTDGGKV